MKTAVITGGAGGLGRALAQGLQAEGWHTVLIDLPGPQLEALESNDRQTPLACDLTDGAALEKLAAGVISTRPSIDLVVYNAGITHIGAFADTSEDAHRKVFEINYFAAISTARVFLSAVRQARGTHLAISSVAGFSPLVKRTAYAASKHALEGFFGSLRSEEKGFGVTTLIAAPSFVATNIGNDQRAQDGTARPGSASDGIDYMSAEDAAEVILKGVKSGKPFIPVGRIATLAWRINRLSPKLFQRLMERNISD